MKPTITVQTFVNAPVDKVWACWTEPVHIVKWTHASDDWHAPRATNDLSVGGVFSTRMESVDGKVGFDFGGAYTFIENNRKIDYAMGDGRKVSIDFIEMEGGTKVVETFDPEDLNSEELQRDGWQAILNNFKKTRRIALIAGGFTLAGLLARR